MNDPAAPIRPEPAVAPRSERVQALVITLALVLLATLPMILSGSQRGRGAADDYRYHWIAIERFAQQWPQPDLSDYASATTPGYHLLLAPLVKAGLNHTGAQLVALGWTLWLMGLLCWSASRTLGRLSIVLMLPVLASMYVLFPGVWLLPDNAGWFFVLALVLLSLRDRSVWWIWAISGLLLVALVWVRQIHIWAAGIVWLSAWLGGADSIPRSLAQLFNDPLRRAGRTLIALALTIPAFATLLWFMGVWGGLVPPMFQGHHQGPNPATPGFILLQLAVISAFFTPLLLPKLCALWAHHWRWVLLAGVIGLGLGLFPHSSYSVEAGRYSGWWNIIKPLPAIAGRSPIFVLGSFAGAIALSVWLSIAPRRDMWVWLGVLIAFTLAQSANHTSWQRYHEPMLLMMIVLILARSGLGMSMRLRVAIGALLLSLVFGGLTAVTMLRAKPYNELAGQRIENGAHLARICEESRST